MVRISWREQIVQFSCMDAESEGLIDQSRMVVNFLPFEPERGNACVREQLTTDFLKWKLEAE